MTPTAVLPPNWDKNSLTLNLTAFHTPTKTAVTSLTNQKSPGKILLQNGLKLDKRDKSNIVFKILNCLIMTAEKLESIQTIIKVFKDHIGKQPT